MENFIAFFTLALFLREFWQMAHCLKIDKPHKALWHFAWLVGIIFLAKFCGNLLTMVA